MFVQNQGQISATVFFLHKRKGNRELLCIACVLYIMKNNQVLLCNNVFTVQDQGPSSCTLHCEFAAQSQGESTVVTTVKY